MKLQVIAITGALLLGSLPLQAAFETKLAPGKYIVTVSPPISEQTADRIENRLDQVAGIGTNDAKPEGSKVHFTVKENSVVEIARVKEAIESIVKGAKVSDPMIDADKAGATY